MRPCTAFPRQYKSHPLRLPTGLDTPRSWLDMSHDSLSSVQKFRLRAVRETWREGGGPRSAMNRALLDTCASRAAWLCATNAGTKLNRFRSRDDQNCEVLLSSHVHKPATPGCAVYLFSGQDTRSGPKYERRVSATLLQCGASGCMGPHRYGADGSPSQEHMCLPHTEAFCDLHASALHS
jgi:hypothetical protein